MTRWPAVSAGLLVILLSTAAVAEPLVIGADRLDSFNSSDPSERTFGPLTFLSGLVLRSRHDDFGGLSGITITADGGAVLMVTDSGFWLRATLDRDGEALAGLSDAEIVAMRDQHGVPVTGKVAADAEAVALQPDGPEAGRAIVAFERQDRIAFYDIVSEGLTAPAVLLSELPAGFSDLVENKGIEGLVAIPESSDMLPGALLAFSEQTETDGAPIPAWILGGETPGRFFVTQIDGFSITDAAQLPSGDIILLERRFRPPVTLHIALRHIPISDIAPDAAVSGDRIAVFSNRYQIDNMEGLAVHLDADGRTVLTLVSDDNYNILQRNLLLQFLLDEEAL